MFEYMLAGIPVICSDFPSWREILEEIQCGIAVDPYDPRAIARAIQFVLDHPEEAQRMGEKGKRAVLTRYNWDREEAKLLAAYEQLSGRLTRQLDWAVTARQND